MVSKSPRKSAPKSQSEKAADKKSKALERAGTAIIDGKPEKAAKILKGKKPKKLKEASARELVADLRVKLAAIRMMDLQVDTAKHNYASLVKRRAQATAELLQELGESAQGRLPFEEAKRNPAAIEAGKESTNGANGTAPKSGDASSDSKPTAQEIEAAGKELDGNVIDRELGEEAKSNGKAKGPKKLADAKG